MLHTYSSWSKLATIQVHLIKIDGITIYCVLWHNMDGTSVLYMYMYIIEIPMVMLHLCFGTYLRFFFFFLYFIVYSPFPVFFAILSISSNLNGMVFPHPPYAWPIFISLFCLCIGSIWVFLPFYSQILSCNQTQLCFIKFLSPPMFIVFGAWGIFPFPLSLLS